MLSSGVVSFPATSEDSVAGSENDGSSVPLTDSGVASRSSAGRSQSISSESEGRLSRMRTLRELYDVIENQDNLSLF